MLNLSDPAIDICFPSHLLSSPQLSELKNFLLNQTRRFRVQIQFGDELLEYESVVRELSYLGFRFDLLIDRAPEQKAFEKALQIFKDPPRLIYLQSRLFPFFLERAKFSYEKGPVFLWYLTKKHTQDIYFGQQLTTPPYQNENLILCDWLSLKGPTLAIASGSSHWTGQDFLFVKASSLAMRSVISSYQYGLFAFCYVESLRMGIFNFFRMVLFLGLHKVWIFATCSPYAPWMKLYWFLRYQYRARFKKKEKRND